MEEFIDFYDQLHRRDREILMKAEGREEGKAEGREEGILQMIKKYISGNPGCGIEHTAALFGVEKQMVQSAMLA